MASKKILQDIIPSNRRSIRSIPLRNKKIEVKEEFDKVKIDKEIKEQEEIIIENPKKKRVVKIGNSKKQSSKFLILFIIIFVCISIIGIALSLIYTKGIVTITPVILNLDVNGNFTAKKDTVSSDQFKYEVVTVSGDSSKIVSAVNGPLIEMKAKGTVVLFNNSSTPQKLVAGTKLSNTTGLIYRTTSTITIPAKKTLAGNVSVGIIADKTGTNYNAKLLDLTGDFKIVEFKNTAKYSLFYGRLKTDIVDGFFGYKKIVSTDIQKETEIELRDQLKAKLLAQISPIIPKDYVFFDDAYTIEYKTLESLSVSSTTASITTSGVLYGFIFNKNNLLKTVATKETRSFTAETYDINGLQNLKFTLNNSKDFLIKKDTPLIFSLKGPVTLMGTFSEENLKNQLKGISLSESNLVFKNYRSIINAHARITPFWLRSFPNSIEHIIIEYKYK